MADNLEAAADWEEWLYSKRPVSKRTIKEGKLLHRILDRLDKEEEDREDGLQSQE